MERTNDEKSYIKSSILDNALVMITVLGESRVISWNHAAETITNIHRRKCDWQQYDLEISLSRWGIP